MASLPSCYRCGKQPCECGATIYHGDILEVLPLLPANSIDLIFGSPPYCDARTYGIDAQRGCREWVDWMLEVSLAAARVCRGPVLWVVAGVTRKRNYWPAPEGLLWKWWERGGDCQCYRPCFFHRVGIPGSGGDDWFRHDVEYVLCLKRPGKLPWSDNTAMGHPPKFEPGGTMSYRDQKGRRKNFHLAAKRVSHTKRNPNGEMDVQFYRPPKIANPGNLVSLKVGGGHLGSKLAHKNEAPFPEKLAKWFILSCCPEGGMVLDPFLGSGTTLRVAIDNSRRGIGIDVRESQCRIAVERLRQGVLELDS